MRTQTQTFAAPRSLLERAKACVDDSELQLITKEFRLAGADVLLLPDVFPSIIPRMKEPTLVIVRFLRVHLDGKVYELGTCENGFWLWDNNVEGWEIRTFDLHDALDVMLKKIRR